MYDFYLFSLISSLILIVLWQTLGHTRVLRRTFASLFLLSLTIYAFSLFDLHLKDFYSLKIVFRDLLLLAFVSFVSLISRRSIFGRISWLLMSGIMIFFLNKNREILIPRDFDLDSTAELLVKLKTSFPSTQTGDLFEYLKASGIAYERAFSLTDDETSDLDNYIALDLAKSDVLTLKRIKEKLRSFSEVLVVEENEQIMISPIESIPVKKQVASDFSDPLSSQQWALQALKVRELNELISDVSKSKKARLFILDTGIDAKHEDLEGNYRSHKSKYDTDIQSHGTHCAGIAGAMSNNGKGVASLSLNNDLFTITAIKVLNDMGMGTQKKIVDGIIEAAEHGADVISLSLGGRSTDKRQRVYEETVAYANQLGAIVVVAAGNSSMNAKDYSPANTNGVISVAAIDENLQIAQFSNTVEDLKMGIAAPGVNILSTVPGNDYKAFNGTSMATPYVAGLVSIMKSLNPDLQTQEIYELLNTNGQFAIEKSKSGNLIDPYKTIKNLIGR